MNALLQEKLQNLSDLELAVLLSVISEQHCLVTCAEESKRNVGKELQLVRTEGYQPRPGFDRCNRLLQIPSEYTTLQCNA